MSLPAAPLASEVRAVLAAVTSAVVVVDSEARILFLNERAVELFGHHESELIARPVEVVLPLGVVAGEQHSGVRRDGSRFPAEVSLTPLETANGCQTILAVRDITGRRQREKRDADVSRAYLSLVAMYDAIVRARDEEGLLAETCRIAVEEAGYLGAWVVRIDEDGVVHKVASAGNLDAFLEQRQLTLDPAEPEGNGTTARALLEGRPVFSSELHGDPTTSAMRALAYAAGIRASATLPLRRDGRTVAVMTLYTDVPDFFDGEMRALVEAVSENVALALDRFVAADRLRAVAAQRHELARRLVGAQEEERARIAADVHDDSVQSLAAADLRLGLLSRQLAEVAPDLVPGVELVQQTVASVSSGLRDLLFDLESTDTSQPLHSIVPGVADHLFEDSDLTCEVTIDLSLWDGVKTLAPANRTQALRIIKEALINVRKHAEATQVRVHIVADHEGVEVRIDDDGVGFDAETVRTPRGHRGLANMRDRAAVSGGWCRVERAGEGRGTTVVFWMPYDETEPGWVAPEY